MSEDKTIGYRAVPNRGRNRLQTINDAYYYKPMIGDKELSMYAETADMAILLALGHKYDGPNSKFGHFAARMLALETVWAE